MDKYAVFGNPIHHSRSPDIHAAFAEQTVQDLTYEPICAPLDSFAETVKTFIASGGRGMNVTVPFKEEAWQLANERSERAELAGAVNTLTLSASGRLHGDNTDGIGIVRDIRDNHGFDFAGKRVLVLGAGGAVRGILQILLQEHPSDVVVANRTRAKAETLADLFSAFGTINACELDNLSGGFDLIINGTAASLQGELIQLPEGLVTANTWCYDMMYSADMTPFNLWAKAQGACCQLDGLGMLVEQAAESFFIWRGVKPNTQPVIEAIRAELAKGK